MNGQDEWSARDSQPRGRVEREPHDGASQPKHASDAVWTEWIEQAKADGTYDAPATMVPANSSRVREISKVIAGYALLGGLFILIVAGLNIVGGSNPPKDPTDYSLCKSFAGSPGVIPEAECVENGEVIRWKDSRDFFMYP